MIDSVPASSNLKEDHCVFAYWLVKSAVNTHESQTDLLLFLTQDPSVRRADHRLDVMKCLSAVSEDEMNICIQYSSVTHRRHARGETWHHMFIWKCQHGFGDRKYHELCIKLYYTVDVYVRSLQRSNTHTHNLTHSVYVRSWSKENVSTCSLFNATTVLCNFLLSWAEISLTVIMQNSISHSALFYWIINVCKSDKMFAGFCESLINDGEIW